MKYEEIINPIEEEYDLPFNTIEVTWRFFKDNSKWSFNSALAGRPIAVRYREACNRRGLIDNICYLRDRWCDRYPEQKGKLKIVGSIPYVLIVCLKTGEVPMSEDWAAVRAPMTVFNDYHRNYEGVGNHQDSSRPIPMYNLNGE